MGLDLDVLKQLFILVSSSSSAWTLPHDADDELLLLPLAKEVVVVGPDLLALL